VTQPDSKTEALRELLAGCKRADRTMQHQLYTQYYSYALSVCLRYVRNRDAAAEVINDGFLKVFRDITRFDTDRYELSTSFRGWLKQIMVRTAIDAYRLTAKDQVLDDLDDLAYQPVDAVPTPLDALAYEDLLRVVQQLPPAYRLVFNLFAIDGYSHEEIAQQLHITTGTSKSNLFKARVYLQRLLTAHPRHAHATSTGR
jgi:RNA polymerase sigma-70 factor (ECF subfamily)